MRENASTWCSSPQEAVLTIPLEPFAMQRLQDRLKDLVSGYGMAVRIAFTAEETPERQALEAVDFAFSSAPKTRTPAKRARRRPRPLDEEAEPMTFWIILAIVGGDRRSTSSPSTTGWSRPGR